MTETGPLPWGPVRALLAERRPGRLLLIAPKRPQPVEDWLESGAGTLTHLRPDEAHRRLPASGRHPVCIATDLLETLEPDTARGLIAGLRDLYAETLCLVVEVDRAAQRGWNERALLALGLRHLAGDGRHDLYVFDLYDYKHTPDWLNSRFWANPEMWDGPFPF